MKILVAHWPIGCAFGQCSSVGGIMAMLLGGDSTIMIRELDVVDRIGYPQSFGRLHLGPCEESKFQGILALNVLFGVRWEESQPKRCHMLRIKIRGGRCKAATLALCELLAATIT
jgi:hypothetical protein